MVLKLHRVSTLSNGKGIEALRGRIRKFVILGQDMDYGRRIWVGKWQVTIPRMLMDRLRHRAYRHTGKAMVKRITE